MSNFPIPLNPNRVIKKTVNDETKAEWSNIDPASMPADLQHHYREYIKARAAAEALRKHFEAEANEAYSTGPGNRLAFGYRFGKLSVSIVPIASPKSSTSLVTLASIAKAR